jgi:hypothetical protein
MARIDIKSNGTGGGGGSGTVTSVGLTSSTLTVSGSPVTTSGAFVANIPDGYLKVGTGITGTLQNVVDTNGTATTLFLSSTAAQFTSPLRITTSDASGFYLDAEDSATNNRFSIKRDPSSQEVTLDFASNPVGSTSLVGAIRTYQDGVNLSNAMSFIEDGSVGIGTNTPIGILHLKRTAATTRMVMDGDAGQSKIITYRSAGLQRFGLYVNNTAESGSNAGSDFAVRAYSDAGTLITTPLFIKRSTGFLGVGNVTAPTQQLHVNGSLRIETGGIYDGTNSIGTSGQVLSSTGTSTAWITPSSGGTPAGSTGAVQFNNAGAFGADSTNFFWDDTNNRLGVGTNSPSATAHLKGSGSTSATTSLLVQNSAGLSSLQVNDAGSVFNNGKGAVATNTAFGNNALAANTTGSNNTANGVDALKSNTTGSSNTAIGYVALEDNTSGSENNALGFQSLRGNTTGSNNTANGNNALRSNATGSNNTAVGRSSLFNNTANSNTAIGADAAFANNTGTGITAIGYQALTASTGNNNTALGFQSAAANTTGTDNTLLGYQAGNNITTGSLNVVIGSSAAPLTNSTGSATIIGQASTGGFADVVIGRSATGGSSCSVLGNGASAALFTGCVVLGRNATATANNQFVVGTAAINAGAVTTESNISTQVWNVIINGVARKILLA